MHAVRNAVVAWPVLAFLLLSILLSWSYWLALLARGAQVGPGSSATHLPGLMGPMIAALVVTAFTQGKPGLRELLLSAVRLPRPRLRNALLALSPVGIGGMAYLALAAVGKPMPALDAFKAYPGLPVGLPLVAVFLLALVVNGYGEETGWRGFATRHLAARHGRTLGTLAVAAMWLVWHAPLFLLNANMAALAGPMFFGWAFALVCGAFVLAGVYLASGRSILVVAVWHTLYNFTVATPAGTGPAAGVISSLVVAWGVYFAFAWWRDERTARAA